MWHVSSNHTRMDFDKLNAKSAQPTAMPFGSHYDVNKRKQKTKQLEIILSSVKGHRLRSHTISCHEHQKRDHINHNEETYRTPISLLRYMAQKCGGETQRSGSYNPDL